MAKGAGFKTILAAGRETAYGTGVTVAEMIPFLSENIKREQERKYDPSLIGKAGYNRTFTDPAQYAGPIEAYLDYGGLDLLIAAALGAAGTPSLSTDLYSNTYTLTPDVDESLTLATNKDVEDTTGLLHEWTGVKIDKLVIKGSAGGDPLSVSIETIAQHHYKTGDAGITNAKADIAAATLLDVPVVMFEDLVFSIATTGSALVPGDSLCIGDFELTIENGLRRLLTNCGLDEPDRDQRRIISLSIGIPSYTSDLFYTWRENHTELQLKFAFSRVTDEYEHELRIGKALVSDFQTPTENENVIAPKAELKIIRAAGDNPTWGALEEELEWAVVNGRSSSPLA
jgi:hypothetical protein